MDIQAHSLSRQTSGGRLPTPEGEKAPGHQKKVSTDSRRRNAQCQSPQFFTLTQPDPHPQAHSTPTVRAHAGSQIEPICGLKTTSRQYFGAYMTLPQVTKQQKKKPQTLALATRRRSASASASSRWSSSEEEEEDAYPADGFGAAGTIPP